MSQDFSQILNDIRNYKKQYISYKSFENYCNYLTEKQAVPVQVNQNDDVYGISKIVNNFLNIISKNPNKKYETHNILVFTPIKISYIPLKHPVNIEGVTTDDTHVFIYKQYTYESYLDIKYLIIHELVHVIQNLRKKKKHLSFLDKMRGYLRDVNTKDINDINDSKYFKLLLYREDLYEIYTWSNDAYITAYQYKCKYPNKSNQDILNYTLKEVEMSSLYLNTTIDLIYKENRIYDVIIDILFGHFSELGSKSEQQFFDRSVFELTIIKYIKQLIHKILCNFSDEETYVSMILQLKETYKPELLLVKDTIIESFIKHLKYWHKQALVKLGKAIQLGIDDATVK